MAVILHVATVKGVGVTAELIGKIGVIHSRGTFNANTRDVDEEFVLEGFATDEDGKFIAATVAESEIRADTLAVDYDGESDAVADRDVAGGVADLLDSKIVDGDFFTSVKRAARAEEAKNELLRGVNMNAGSPDGRRVGTGVDLRGDVFNASDSDKSVVADDFERFRASTTGRGSGGSRRGLSRRAFRGSAFYCHISIIAHWS